MSSQNPKSEGGEECGALGALPPLREVIAAHDLRAEKKFGQNFLLDGNITDKIAMSEDMSKILSANNYFFFRSFFICKLLLRIKETILKN